MSAFKTKTANFKSLFGIWKHLSDELRRRIILLIGLMLVASAIEVLTLSALFPLLQVISGSTTNIKFVELNFGQNVADLIEQDSQLSILLFVILLTVSGCFRLVVLKSQVFTAYRIGGHINKLICEVVLGRTFEEIKQISSSEFISTVTVKVNDAVVGAVLPALSMMSAIPQVSGILLVLFFVSPITASVLIGILLIFYGLTAIYSRSLLMKNSTVISGNQKKITRLAQEIIGGAREVKLGQLHKFYLNLFRETDTALKKAEAGNSFQSSFPKPFIESLLLVSIFIFLFFAMEHGFSVVELTPLLGGFALAGLRSLPLVQQIYSGWSILSGYSKSMVDILDMLTAHSNRELVQAKTIGLRTTDNIMVSDVGYSFAGCDEQLFRSLNLEFRQNRITGIIGPSGEGKTSLIDLLMGLLRPSSGSIAFKNSLVTSDSPGWHTFFALVPQDVFLVEASIAENVAFGLSPEEIDYSAVVEAMKIACIYDELQKLPNGIRSKIGERGGNLSGGQRQRLGIARALYMKRPILVLDEATSSLDAALECRVMQSLAESCSNISVILITHRQAVLSFCDDVYRVSDGMVTREKVVSES